MSTFLSTIAPLIPTLLLTALFVWALERSNRRHGSASWVDDYRHAADHDADHRRSVHDVETYGRAA